MSVNISAVSLATRGYFWEQIGNPDALIDEVVGAATLAAITRGHIMQADDVDAAVAAADIAVAALPPIDDRTAEVTIALEDEVMGITAVDDDSVAT